MKYNPYRIGRQLYRDGLGVSDIAGAVRTDADIEECYRGYCEQQFKTEYRQKYREIRSQLGYTRIGRYGK